MYPTIEQVESADQTQLCRWQRFLQSPGQIAIGRIDFGDTMNKEAKIMDRIIKRVQEGGGFTPEISKALGWEP